MIKLNARIFLFTDRDCLSILSDDEIMNQSRPGQLRLTVSINSVATELSVNKLSILCYCSVHMRLDDTYR